MQQSESKFHTTFEKEIINYYYIDVINLKGLIYKKITISSF